MYLGLGKLVLASTVPSSRHPLNVRSDTGPDLGGGSELGAAPIFLPAAAQGERSGAASPWTPTGLLASLALHSLPTAWGHTRGPYGRRKRAQRSPLAGGRMRPVPLRPPRPPAAPVRPLPRQPRPPPTARAGRGRAPGQNPTAHAPSPRGPPPVKGPHGTPHKPPRGARGLVEVAVQTPDGSRPPAAAFARAKAMRGGQSGAHARGGADAVR